MRPPCRRLTIRALMVFTALFALDFTGIAWDMHQQLQGPSVRSLTPHARLWAFVEPLTEFIVPVFYLTPLFLTLTMIYYYAPHGPDEILAVLAILGTAASFFILTL